ncbi:MAG: alpha-amylase family glycosyl hydrolase [Bacteroidota bacterium]|nr:alpha-amylase family glycosyl hydrolase [Bacteroidota bacterium]
MNKTEIFHILTRVVLGVLFLAIVWVVWAFTAKKPRPSVVVHPEWSRSATIYEVNIRQYTPEGTFAAFSRHLPRLKKMGVDILWLMPVNPIGIENRKGTLGSYYSVRDYLSVNPEFGTLKDLKDLVKKAHELGMYVIIDWVANHTSWDNNLIREHPEWYTHDSSGKIIAPVPDWTDAADLNYDQPGLRKYMTDALIYWVKEAGIDGFRCDVAGMVPVNFWNRAVPEVKKVKHVFMLAEWETPEMHDSAFDMTYSWDMFKTMNSIAKKEQTANYIDTVLKHNAKRYNPDAYRMLFTSNHDENSWNGSEYERMGDGAKAFAVLTFTLPGMPLIYSGQEAAFNHRLLFFDKDSIKWDNYPLASFYSRLIRLRKENSALWSGTTGGRMLKIKTRNDKAVYAFSRENNKDHVLVVVNLSVTPQSVKIKGNSIQGTYTEVFTGKPKIFGPESTLSLKPWEYLVFEKKQ